MPCASVAGFERSVPLRQARNGALASQCAVDGSARTDVVHVSADVISCGGTAVIDMDRALSVEVFVRRVACQVFGVRAKLLDFYCVPVIRAEQRTDMVEVTNGFATRAAAVLRIRPSEAHLERDLGVALFRRTTSSVTLSKGCVRGRLTNCPSSRDNHWLALLDRSGSYTEGSIY